MNHDRDVLREVGELHRADIIRMLLWLVNRGTLHVADILLWKRETASGTRALARSE